MVIIKIMYHLGKKAYLSLTYNKNVLTFKCENQSPDKLIRSMFTSHDKLMETLRIKQTVETNQPFVLCGKCYNKHMLKFMALTYHAVLVEPLQRAVKPFSTQPGH